MSKKGNKRWKHRRRAEFERIRRLCGYGPGYLHHGAKAKIWQMVAERSGS